LSSASSPPRVSRVTSPGRSPQTSRMTSARRTRVSTGALNCGWTASSSLRLRRPTSSTRRDASCSTRTGISASSSPTSRCGSAAGPSRGRQVGHTASPSSRCPYSVRWRANNPHGARRLGSTARSSPRSSPGLRRRHIRHLADLRDDGLDATGARVDRRDSVHERRRDRAAWTLGASARSRLRDQVILFNFATAATILIGIATLYATLFLLIIAAAELLLSPDALASGLGHTVSAGDYARLAWFTASLATVGGALGAALESDEAVRGCLRLFRKPCRGCGAFVARIGPTVRG
jgi:hypothetical protein